MKTSKTSVTFSHTLDDMEVIREDMYVYLDGLKLSLQEIVEEFYKRITDSKYRYVSPE